MTEDRKSGRTGSRWNCALWGLLCRARAALGTCKGDIVGVRAALASALLASSSNPVEYGVQPGPDMVPDSGLLQVPDTLLLHPDETPSG